LFTPRSRCTPLTGIQALQRAAPSLPMKPGHVERREFEFIRHGSKALIAAFAVATGKVRGNVGDTRTEADFVSFLDNLFTSAALAARWEAVCDNLNTTCPKASSGSLPTTAASLKI